MIGADEIRRALQEHVDSISAAYDTGVQATWAVPAGVEVDDVALFEAARIWSSVKTAGISPAAACGEGFVSGFVVGVRAARAEQ